MKRIKRINLQHNQVKTVPAGLLKKTALQDIKLEGCPLMDKGKIDGWDNYLERNGKLMSKNIDQRVKAGDLSLVLLHSTRRCAPHSCLYAGRRMARMSLMGIEDCMQPGWQNGGHGYRMRRHFAKVAGVGMSHVRT